jgi:hypothetical protein
VKPLKWKRLKSAVPAFRSMLDRRREEGGQARCQSPMAATALRRCGVHSRGKASQHQFDVMGQSVEEGGSAVKKPRVIASAWRHW